MKRSLIRTKLGSRVWFADRPMRKVLWRNHDALFVAVGRLRVRIMKRGRKRPNYRFVRFPDGSVDIQPDAFREIKERW